MSLIGFLLLLLIAAIAGAIGQALAGYSPSDAIGGLLVSIVVGMVGAVLGYWLATALGLPELFVINIDGQPFPVVWAIIGSALFALVAGLLTRRRVAY